MSNQHLEIVPSNITSDGKLSFKNGQPVIQFIIGEQQRYLLGQSVRLVGNFSVYSDSTPSLGSANANLNMDGRTSLYSTIDQLVIKSQSTNQTIEHIRNYNRFMSSYLNATNDLGDGLSHLNETNNQVLNYNAMKNAVVDNPTNIGNANTFSLPLPCGLLNGSGPIPLAQGWGLGGLIIEVHLSPDSNVLYNYLDATDGTAISDSYYEYKHMYLSCEVNTPSPQDLAKVQSQGQKGNTFEYNSISSYYTTINSTNAIINFSLGLSRVLGVFCNFITASHINNRGWNGMTTWYPTNSDGSVSYVNQLVFTRGGERLPLDYNIDTLQERDPNNKFPDAQILRNYVNAIHSFPKNKRNLLNPENNMLKDDAVNGNGFQTLIDGGSGFGVGVAFDSISNQGLDFSSTNFGINMDLNLTSDNPQAVFMFAHSKTTLVFNGQGIQVIN